MFKVVKHEDIKKILEKNVKPDFTVGEFLGEGMTSIVFEGFDKNGTKVAIKYFKKPTSNTEELLLKQFGKLIKKVNNKIWIINFCGNSLHRYVWNPKKGDDPDIKKVIKDPKKVLEIGLKTVYDLHKLGWLHTDIKPDNICVKKDSKGNVIFELIDFGNSHRILQINPLNDASEYLHEKYRSKNKGKSFYQLYQDKTPYEEYKDPINGNAVWSLRKAISPLDTPFVIGDDIEGLILALAYIFDYKNCTVGELYEQHKIRTKIKNELLNLRLYPEKCSIQLYKDAIKEVRKNMNITVPELCKALNLNCNLQEDIISHVPSPKPKPKRVSKKVSRKVPDSPIISSPKPKRVSKKVSRKVPDSPIISSPKPKRVSKKVPKKISDSPIISSPKPKRVSKKVSRKVPDSPIISSPKPKRVSKKVPKKISDSPIISSPKPKRVSKKVPKKISDSPIISSPKPKRISRKVSRKVPDSPIISSPKPKRVSKKVSRKVPDSPIISSPKPKRVSRKVPKKIADSPIISSPKPKRVSKKVPKKISDSPIISSPKPKRVSKKVSRKVPDSPIISSPKPKRISRKVSRKVPDSPIILSPKPKKVEPIKVKHPIKISDSPQNLPESLLTSYLEDLVPNILNINSSDVNKVYLFEGKKYTILSYLLNRYIADENTDSSELFKAVSHIVNNGAKITINDLENCSFPDIFNFLLKNVKLTNEELIDILIFKMDKAYITEYQFHNMDMDDFTYETNMFDMASELIESVDITKPGKNGDYIIHHATDYGFIENILERIDRDKLNKKDYINLRNKEGLRPLDYMLKYFPNIQKYVIQLLIDNGAIIDGNTVGLADKHPYGRKILQKQDIISPPVVSDTKNKQAKTFLKKVIVPVSKSPLISSVKVKEVKKPLLNRGLIINNKNIMSISNPVNFHYLRPKKQVYDDGNGKYFPLIILFGDVHFSFENSCVPCSCSIKSEKQNSCCYELTNNKFLKLLDGIASKHIIDFYVETFFVGSPGFEKGYLGKLTMGPIMTCFNRHLRGTPKDKCPTKNIRWQGGDIRVAGYKDPRKKENIYVISEKYMKSLYLEFQINYLFELLRPNQPNLKRFNEELKNTYFNNLSNFQSFLLSIYDDKEDKMTPKELTNKLFNMIDKHKENSGIYKQVKKQTYKDFSNIELWKNFYCTSLNKEIEIFKFYNKDIKETISNVVNLDKFITGELPVTDSLRNTIKFFFFVICTPLVDLYTVARIFKQPTGGKRSDLSILYFGSAHTDNIKRFLESTQAYETVASVKDHYINKEINRCLDLKTIYANIDKDLKNHK
jgi:hypothetical protein